MGHDHLIGGAGTDIRNGGIAFDYVRYDTALTGVVVDLTNPATNTDDAAGDSYLSAEGLVGSVFNDTLSGDNVAMISTSSHCRTAPRSIQMTFCLCENTFL